MNCSLLNVTIVVCLMIFSCSANDQYGASHLNNRSNKEGKVPTVQKEQIGNYIVALMEDSQGNIWIGTLGNGVAKYDGKSLVYLDESDGLVSNYVVSILEDDMGNFWFATQNGLSYWDGSDFTNYTIENGLCDNMITKMFFGPKAKLWITTWSGLCTFNGQEFESFELPTPDVEIKPYHSTAHWTTDGLFDRNGHLWIARDGFGLTVYDGSSFTHITEADGLPANNVQVIQEDNKGNIWMGTRVGEKDHPQSEKRYGEGGLAMWDGEKITVFPDKKGLTQSEVYAIYEDTSENIWISTTNLGAYKFDGESFELIPINIKEGEPSNAIQSFLQDSKGYMWFGCSGGLFKMVDDTVQNITREDLNK